MTNLINYSANDIDFTTARRAYEGISHVPERRAEQEQAWYVEHMTSVEATFTPWLTNENREQMDADLEQYRLKYVANKRDILHAKARVISVLVTGPANFPTRRNEKANSSLDTKLERFFEWERKAMRRLRNTYDPHYLAYAPISSDDEDAIIKLEAKIDKAEKHQERMKAANKVIRSKTKDKDEKVNDLLELGFSQEVIDEMFIPTYGGKVIAFKGFYLTNNNANIKRMKQRVIGLEREALARVKRQEAGTDEVTVNGVTIYENDEVNRLQLLFSPDHFNDGGVPGKPSAEIRSKLKSRGFRWSRRFEAWQRQLNDNARYSAQVIVNDLGEGTYSYR